MASIIYAAILVLAGWAGWHSLGPTMKVFKRIEPEPILPSELDDWDAQFLELTGKKVAYDGRTCYDPKLVENNITSIGSLSLQGMLSGSLLNGNAYQQNLFTQQQLMAQQQGLQNQIGGPWNSLLAPGLSGLFGGLGGKPKQ
jgi:hypothetical protein